MSDELLSSKLISREKDPEVRAIQAVASSVPYFSGIAERGPLEATLITSPTEYTRKFGGYIASGYLKNSVEGFFRNGGTRCWVKRNVHYSDPADANTATCAAASATIQSTGAAATSGYSQAATVGPYALVNGDTLICKIDGGSNLTATFSATAGARESTGTSTYTLTNGMTLTVKVDGGAVQTVTFATGNFADISAATALEVAAVINAALVGASASASSSNTKVTITSDKKGTGSSIQVTGGTANSPLNFSTSVASGTGNVANIAAVTVAEVKTVVEAAVAGCTVSNVGGAPRITSNTTGASSSVQVVSTSTADDELGFDNATHAGLSGSPVDTLGLAGKTPGSYANGTKGLSTKIAAATSGEAARFNLTVVKDGATVERFPNLTMDPTDARYCVTIVNDERVGSNYIALDDLEAATATYADARPANGTYLMTGGNDGLASIDDNDFIGAAGVNGRTGLRAFDLVEEGSMLAVPDRATAAVHNAMVDYCEITRGRKLFAVLDPPANMSAEGIVEYVEETASLLELSEFGGMFWPRIKTANPSKAVYGTGTEVTIPPSGHICGAFARNDARNRGGGIYEAAAGIDYGILRGVSGVETDEVKDEDKRDLVAPKLINVIRAETGRPFYIDGHDTLKTSGPFPSIPERRGVIFMEQSIISSLQFVRHRNNTPTLRNLCTRLCFSFLKTQMGLGAFRSTNPDEAFFVDFGTGLNTTSVVFSQKLLGNIGLATNKPIKWGIIDFEQDTRDLLAEIAA